MIKYNQVTVYKYSVKIKMEGAFCMEKKLLLIVNSHSGKRKKFSVFDKIQKRLTEQGWQTDMVFTKHSGHAAELSAEAEGYDRIVCVGGDGTLSEVCNGILVSGRNVQLGYVPTGSTNDFARGIGLPRKIKKSTLLAASEECFPIDAGAFVKDGEKERFFSYVASFGMFTSISYSTAQSFKNKFGHFAYVFEGLKSLTDLQKFRSFNLKIEADGEMIEGEFIFGAITNSTSLGGLVKLDKNSVTVCDGLFEILLIKKPNNIFDLTDTVGQLMNKKYNRSRIIFRHVKSLSLISEHPIEWTLDGEYAGESMRADINVRPAALNFVRHETAKNHLISHKKTP